MNKHDIIKHGK